MRGDVAQVQSLLHGGIAAADDRDGFAAIEESIAGGAGRHTLAPECLLGRQAQVLCGGACGDDQRIAGVLAVVAGQPKRPVAQIDLVDVVGDDFSIESLRVGSHALHQRGALQVIDVPWPIVHVGGGHELSALLQPGDE